MDVEYVERQSARLDLRILARTLATMRRARASRATRPTIRSPAPAGRAVSDLVVVGAGGHGRELFATLTALNAVRPTWNVLGFVDDGPVRSDRIERLGSRLLGDLTWLESNPLPYALGVGDPARCAHASSSGSTHRAPVRRPWCTRVRRSDRMFDLGDGVVVYDRCTLTTNVSIGPHTHLNVGCAVQHDTDGRARSCSSARGCSSTATACSATPCSPARGPS